MSEKLLQLNFKFSVTGDEYTQAVSPLAEKYAAVPGLRWKVWIINEAESEAGGIYLFDDEIFSERTHGKPTDKAGNQPPRPE